MNGEDERMSGPRATGSLSPTTTKEEDLKASSQRRINLTWEATQSGIALMVVLANVIDALWTRTNNQFLTSAFFLVIGFYFGRTNHARPTNKTQS